jgi:hypothetical protein
MEAEHELKVEMRKNKFFTMGVTFKIPVSPFHSVKGNDCERNNIPEERGM